MAKKKVRPKKIYVLFDNSGDRFCESFDKKEMIQEMRYYSKIVESGPFTLETYVLKTKRKDKS